MIRNIYKYDYRGYEKDPTRELRKGIELLKYSKTADRNTIRKFLMEDFHAKCAYCGWENAEYADSVFHIEHTKSKSNHKELSDDYSYLALACPVCNCSKNNKEVEYYIDPIDPEFKKLFYRNKFGAIVINNDLTDEEKELSKKYLYMIGLYKELYKIDYVFSALKKIQSCEMALGVDERDCEFIVQIMDIICFINKVARRRTVFTDF